MIIHNYVNSSNKDLIVDYIKSLPKDEQVDAYSVIKCLKDGEFDKIKFKQWQKKIYEVYFYKNNRIFYLIADGNNIYLLHACRKQKNQTEKKDKNVVIKRAKEIGEIIGKKFI